ncbi:hypothetical protein JIR001_17570 [Polycladomyces abyssicola]|uniref:VOC domain-containing protein n=1 Tax=Polycladomyces abyssicola TaxID=1125966 RepID=A0A8D5ZKZ1_9BACL|nr:VOC family protein [Polycladomyces abyssicola]BCU81974.1 hypothetical protein JIR001_17570 [Polycladomyces abyssicola]
MNDYRKAQQWYQEKLGLTSTFDENEKYVVLDLAGTSLTLHELSDQENKVGKEWSSTYPILYTNEIEQAHQYLGEQQVEVEPIQEAGNVRFFGFYDLDANRLEVCCY